MTPQQVAAAANLRFRLTCTVRTEAGSQPQSRSSSFGNCSPRSSINYELSEHPESRDKEEEAAGKRTKRALGLVTRLNHTTHTQHTSTSQGEEEESRACCLFDSARALEQRCRVRRRASLSSRSSASRRWSLPCGTRRARRATCMQGKLKSLRRKA